MTLRRVMTTAAVAAACLSALAAAPQNEKQPITSDTGRFGNASGITRKYEGYLYGVVKEKNPDALILTKTKAGVEQDFRITKKTKFTLDGKASAYEKLKVGDSVYVDVDTDKKTGEMTAKKVVSGVDIPSIPTAP